ncbi:MAG TPA: tannase/feruloyl esterase family alpha/beta hydrolase [Bryobacteraceae bacterium]|nr:tannase/feruloyl esterase family alpha/beta hydrolase [Bryobacteraceae bacterium]
MPGASSRLHFTTIALFGCIATFPLPAAAASCDDLAKLTLANTTFTAQAVPAGAFTPPGGQPIQGLPAFCRVAGVLKPSNDSEIQFEVWLPSSGWNGKFQGIGNGGFAGSISYAAMANAVLHGYATASTDTGHHAGVTDGSWALGHPEKVVDFGYRAIHETTDKAKALVRAFYGNSPKHSYFSSCSNGGRQALMEAQRFPADYDGIIAGAPANYWTHLLTGAIWNLQVTLDDPASYIPASKVPAIEAATLEACDAADGVKDGVIDNPPQCHFDPAKLLCKGPDSDACLTAPQVAALKKIYDGPKNSKGAQLFPGFSVGGETGFGGWSGWITGPGPAKSTQYAFGTQFFKNMVFDDAQWDFKTFNMDRDPKVADDKVGQRFNATNPDLSAFKKRGGKLILYHGWSDAAIPPVNTIQYYQSVAAKMGAKDTSAFVRLFMVPGMQHCGGGPGPNSFGQASVAQGDAQHDMASALEKWAEGGQPPEQIVATRYKGAGPASGVARTRPLCAYPKIARWNGSGSTDDAASFTCVEADSPRSK